MAFLRHRIIDISLPVYPGMATYPGNPRFRVRPLRTKTTYISELTLGSHAGTHADAPRHVSLRGKGAGEIPLSLFIGPCRVLDLTRTDRAIEVSDIARLRIQRGERILCKTWNSLRGFKRFYRDYIYIGSAAAAFLAQKRIALIGIDALSIKQRGSMDNRPHTEFLKKGIPILEGLDLARVAPGRYTLVALPLKFVGIDGSPLRAVLIV